MSIAGRSLEQPGGCRDVLVRQRRDHEAVDGVLRRLRSARHEQDEVLPRVARLAPGVAPSSGRAAWRTLVHAARRIQHRAPLRLGQRPVSRAGRAEVER